MFYSGFPRRRGETIKSLVPHILGVLVGIFIGATFMKVRAVLRASCNSLFRCHHRKFFLDFMLLKV